MAAKTKISRRLVVTSLIEMLEAGKSTVEVAQILAAYLVQIGRTRDIELYIRDIELAVAKKFGVVTTYVSSAKTLNQKTRDLVKKLVKSSSGAKDIEMVELEDPRLIGGIIIKTADAEFDGSIRTKLQKLRSI